MVVESRSAGTPPNRSLAQGACFCHRSQVRIRSRCLAIACAKQARFSTHLLHNRRFSSAWAAPRQPLYDAARDQRMASFLCVYLLLMAQCVLKGASACGKRWQLVFHCAETDAAHAAHACAELPPGRRAPRAVDTHSLNRDRFRVRTRTAVPRATCCRIIWWTCLRSRDRSHS